MKSEPGHRWPAQADNPGIFAPRGYPLPEGSSGQPAYQVTGPRTPANVRALLHRCKSSWLTNSELQDVLTNWSAYDLQPCAAAPTTPPGGSLFLFDRNANRYFRKDGHAWRTKSDGKSVRETHEKLKVNGSHALNCYYAHSVDNTLQRRSYWLLEENGMVLVHYLACASSRRATFIANQDSGLSAGKPRARRAPRSPRSNGGVTAAGAAQADAPLAQGAAAVGADMDWATGSSPSLHQGPLHPFSAMPGGALASATLRPTGREAGEGDGLDRSPSLQVPQAAWEGANAGANAAAVASSSSVQVGSLMQRLEACGARQRARSSAATSGPPSSDLRSSNSAHALLQPLQEQLHMQQAADLPSNNNPTAYGLLQQQQHAHYAPPGATCHVPIGHAAGSIHGSHSDLREAHTYAQSPAVSFPSAVLSQSGISETTLAPDESTAQHWAALARASSQPQSAIQQLCSSLVGEPSFCPNVVSNLIAAATSNPSILGSSSPLLQQHLQLLAHLQQMQMQLQASAIGCMAAVLPGLSRQGSEAHLSPFSGQPQGQGATAPGVAQGHMLIDYMQKLASEKQGNGEAAPLMQTPSSTATPPMHPLLAGGLAGAAGVADGLQCSAGTSRPSGAAPLAPSAARAAYPMGPMAGLQESLKAEAGGSLPAEACFSHVPHDTPMQPSVPAALGNRAGSFCAEYDPTSAAAMAMARMLNRSSQSPLTSVGGPVALGAAADTFSSAATSVCGEEEVFSMRPNSTPDGMDEYDLEVFTLRDTRAHGGALHGGGVLGGGLADSDLHSDSLPDFLDGDCDFDCVDFTSPCNGGLFKAATLPEQTHGSGAYVHVQAPLGMGSSLSSRASLW